MTTPLLPFIDNNLNDPIAHERAKHPPSHDPPLEPFQSHKSYMKRRRYTHDEDTFLLDNWHTHKLSRAKMAKALGRSLNSIMHRALSLGLRGKDKPL